jgi:uncharacterized protein
MDWKANILTTDEEIGEVLRNTQTIAVLGIKPETHSMQPAFYVPQYMQRTGHKIIPVPVYYPDITQIMGERVYRKMEDIPVPVDMVNVFRRSNDVPPHTEDILKLKPQSVWLQLGIRHDKTAETLAKEGIKVIQDACLMVEHRRLGK